MIDGMILSIVAGVIVATGHRGHQLIAVRSGQMIDRDVALMRNGHASWWSPWSSSPGSTSALMESSRAGATVGKLAVGLRVVRRADGATHRRFLRATGRDSSQGHVTPLVPFAIGYLLVAFTDRKRGLHDIMAGTLVVRTSLTRPAIAMPSVPIPALPRRRIRRSGMPEPHAGQPTGYAASGSPMAYMYQAAYSASIVGGAAQGSLRTGVETTGPQAVRGRRRETAGVGWLLLRRLRLRDHRRACANNDKHDGRLPLAAAAGGAIKSAKTTGR